MLSSVTYVGKLARVSSSEIELDFDDVFKLMLQDFNN